MRLAADMVAEARAKRDAILEQAGGSGAEPAPANGGMPVAQASAPAPAASAAPSPPPPNGAGKSPAGYMSVQEFEAYKAKNAQDFQNMRSNLQQQAARERQALEEDNRVLTERLRAISSAPAPTAAATAPNDDAEEQRFIQTLRDQYPAETVDAYLRIADFRSRRMARQELQQLRETLTTELAPIRDSMDQIGQAQRRNEGSVFEQFMAANGYPDWREIRKSAEFALFVDTHPLGNRYRQMIWPQRADDAAKGVELLDILGQFIAANPNFQAEAARAEESAQRDDAAAAAAQDQIAPGTQAPAGGDQPIVYLSEVERLTIQNANNPKFIIELRNSVRQARAEGRLVAGDRPA